MTNYVLDVGEAEVIDEAEIADGPIIAEDEKLPKFSPLFE